MMFFGNYLITPFVFMCFLAVTPAVWHRMEAKESVIRYVINRTDSVILTLVKH